MEGGFPQAPLIIVSTDHHASFVGWLAGWLAGFVSLNYSSLNREDASRRMRCAVLCCFRSIIPQLLAKGGSR